MQGNNNSHRSRSFPSGEPGNFSPPARRPQIQPMQPSTQPRGILRTVLTMGMPGLVIIFILGLMQVFAPYDWKPAVMVGKAIATYEVTVIQDTLMDKTKAEELIAQARADGERQAEIVFQTQLKELEFTYQQEFATVQAQLQTGMDAYKSLYERANMIQQAVYQMEGTILQHKQQAIRGTHGGKEIAANIADVGCLFVPDLCKVGDGIRDKMTDELVRAGSRGAGQISRDYLQGLPDPAGLQGRIMLPPPVQ